MVAESVGGLSDFGSVAAGGILALMILKEVFAFVKPSKHANGLSSMSKIQGSQLQELYDWHKPDPETGRFKWYDRHEELLIVMKAVSDNITAQTHLLREVHRTCMNRDKCGEEDASR